MTASVVSSRRRVAASFPDLEHGATGSAVINGAQSWGLNEAPVRSERSVVSPFVINVDPTYGSNVLNAPVETCRYSLAPISSNPSVTLAPITSNLSKPLINPLQSTPMYVVSDPHSYAYTHTNEMLASTQPGASHSYNREYVLPSRRPTVDDSTDDDTDVENRPGGRQSYAVKTPRMPKTHSNMQVTMQNNEDTSQNLELQNLRGQFEQYAQVLQSLSNRVEDLTDTVTAVPLDQTAVKQPETDSTNRLVEQMKTLIDTVSKKRKPRKTKLSTVF
jgi:hypothetical protein